MESVTRRDLRNVYEAEGESAAYSKLYELGENVPEWSNVKDWEAFTNSLVADLNQQVTLQKKIVTQEEIARDKKLSDLFIAAKDPSSNLGEVVLEFEKMVSEGVEGGEKRISQDKITSFYTSIKSSQKEQRDTLDVFTEISNKWGGDSSVIVDQKDVNKFYDDVVLNIPDLDNATKADFVNKMLVVPNTMKRQLKQYLMSGDAELIKEAADLTDRIDEMPGIIQGVFSAEEKAFANQVNLLAPVMGSEKAIKEAREITDPRNAERIKARKDKIKEEKFYKDDAEIVEGYFESGAISSAFRTLIGSAPIRIDPVNKARIEKEFRETRDALYISGFGDKSEVDSRALKEVSRNYGEFKFGERNLLMKYPMGLYYNSEKGTDYIVDQAVEDASKIMGYKVSPENIYFEWDDRTAREAEGKRPSYLMGVMDEGGDFIPTGERFYPDPSIPNAEAQQETDESVERGRMENIQMQKNNQYLKDFEKKKGFTRLGAI